MKEEYTLGSMGRLELTANRSAAAGLLLLWAAMSTIFLRTLRLAPGAALAGGLLATMSHLFSEIWHQFGHARAAQATGFPMSGIHLWGILGRSVYPRDEPDLPAEVHVQRALGGPRSSALLVIAFASLAFVTRRAGGLLHILAIFGALENLLVFTIGAFLPLPFFETDGEILRRYRHSHRKRMITVQE